MPDLETCYEQRVYGHPCEPLKFHIDALGAQLAERERYRSALRHIAEFDPFQGGPIAPRPNPTTDAMRRIARAALDGEGHVTVPIPSDD